MVPNDPVYVVCIPLIQIQTPAFRIKGQSPAHSAHTIPDLIKVVILSLNYLKSIAFEYWQWRINIIIGHIWLVDEHFVFLGLQILVHESKHRRVLNPQRSELVQFLSK